MTVLNYSQEREIAELLVGRRVVQAEMGDFDLPEPREYYWSKAEGRLVLDDGTVLYLAGNDGGCACSAGCYPLSKVAAADNIITAARVEDASVGDGDNYIDGEFVRGAYRIFVFADAAEINIAEFVGDDGNGYYGTGFDLIVVRPS